MRLRSGSLLAVAMIGIACGSPAAVPESPAGGAPAGPDPDEAATAAGGRAEPGSTGVRWARVFASAGEEVFGGLAATCDGGVLLREDGRGRELRLEAFGASGATRWERRYAAEAAAASGRDVVAAPGGELYVRSSVRWAGFDRPPYVIDLGGGPRTGTSVEHLSADGSWLGHVADCQYDCNVEVVAATDRGDVVVRETSSIGPWRVERVRSDGSRQELYREADFGRVRTGAVADAGCRVAVFGPGERILCGGSRADLTPTLSSVAADGSVEWTVDVRGLQGAVSSLGVARDGAVVAAGSYQGGAGAFAGRELAFDGAPGELNGFVLAVASDGTPRWARPLPHPATSLAVGPGGESAVVAKRASRGCVPVDVLLFEPSGAPRWSRPVPAWCPNPAYTAESYGVAFGREDVVVAGTWSGTFDFGAGPTNARGADVFLVGFTRERVRAEEPIAASVRPP